MRALSYRGLERKEWKLAEPLNLSVFVRRQLHALRTLCFAPPPPPSSPAPFSPRSFTLDCTRCEIAWPASETEDLFCRVYFQRHIDPILFIIVGMPRERGFLGALSITVAHPLTGRSFPPPPPSPLPTRRRRGPLSSTRKFPRRARIEISDDKTKVRSGAFSPSAAGILALNSILYVHFNAIKVDQCRLTLI